MQAWIYIDIFDTQHSYRLTSQSETFTNQIFKRLFEILNEKKFRIHQDKCIQNWNSKQNELLQRDEENEEYSDEEKKEDEEENEEDNEEDKEENEKKSDCSNIDCK